MAERAPGALTHHPQVAGVGPGALDRGLNPVNHEMFLKGRTEAFCSKISLTQRHREHFRYSGKTSPDGISQVATLVPLPRCTLRQKSRHGSQYCVNWQLALWKHDKVYYI